MYDSFEHSGCPSVLLISWLLEQGMRTLEKLGVNSALTDEVGFRGPSGIPQIFRYVYQWRIQIHAHS